MLSLEVCTHRTCIFAPTDLLGVAASDTLEIQNAVGGGASTKKKKNFKKKNTIQNVSQLTVVVGRSSYDSTHRTPTKGKVIYAIVGFISLIMVSSMLGTVSAHKIIVKLG